MKKIIKIILSIVIGIILVTGIILLNTKKNVIQKDQIAINYLNSKYGDGGWNIIKSEDYIYENTSKAIFSPRYIKDGKQFKITSKYIDNNSFYLYVNDADMVTDDYFLPTYYSIKYNLDYGYGFSELIDKMVYISDFHYPYDDYVYTSSGWYFDRPKCRINQFLMRSFYFPISIDTSPKKEKVLDIIPNEQRIPELNEIIQLVENYYSSGRTRNENNSEEELYDLVFKQKASEDEIIEFISNHITKVDGLEVIYYLNKNKER